jgi:hypothetical protein
MTAIDHLNEMNDGSVRIVRYITYVISHYVHMLQEYNFPASDSAIMLFHEHISRLDALNLAFLIDRCIYIAAVLTEIDI